MRDIRPPSRPAPATRCDGVAVRAWLLTAAVVVGHPAAIRGSESDARSLLDPAFAPVTIAGAGVWRADGLDENLAGAQRILFHLQADTAAKCVLAFDSPTGRFSASFAATPGEQVLIIPSGVFERTGERPSWNAIRAISLDVRSAGTVTVLGCLTASQDVNAPPDGGLWVVDAVTRVNPIGTAWPMRAIIDLETYPAKVEQAGVSLAKWIETLSGKKLPLNPEGIRPEERNTMIVGQRAALEAQAVTQEELDRQGFNGFVVKTGDARLVIASASIQGLNYGVYRYLDRNGLRFFTRDVFTRPPATLDALAAVNVEDRPFFEGKRISGPFSIFGDSTAGFSLGDPRTADIDAEYPCDKTLWIDHTAAFLVPKKMYLDDHPEYYILRGDGSRLTAETPDVRLMVCQTNPGGIAVAARRAIAWIESQRDRKYFVIQQGDDMEACMCDGCEAKRREGYNEADLLLHWVNAIAREVAGPFPDKSLLCYAYVSTQPAPAMLKPEPNVQVLYAPWPTPISAPNGFRDFDAPENIIAGSQLRDWIRQCGPANLGVYDYNSGGSLTMRAMGDRVKWCARHGMRGGFWYCGTPQIFRDLFNYVHGQLNWDPFQNSQSLEKSFIRAYYGDAAPVMEEIVASVYDRLEADDRNNGRGPSRSFFDKEFVRTLMSRFDEAAALAPERLRKEIETDRTLIVGQGLAALKPTRQVPLTDDEFDVFGMLFAADLQRRIDDYSQEARVAVERGTKPPALAPLADHVWGLTHVRVETVGLVPGELPPRLGELVRDATSTIRKHRILDFTERTADGVRIPALAFSGGEGPIYYLWKCEGKVAAWVKGAMTDVSVMQADFTLTAAEAAATHLDIEGQDSDKLWCPPAAIRISLNGQPIFEGSNGFVKQGWSRRTFTIPAGALVPGRNVLTVENLTATDDQTAHWFMCADAWLRKP